MDITLKHKAVEPRGSFVAWGMGFCYTYNAVTRILYISEVAMDEPLYKVSLEAGVSATPLQYTQILEKALQVTALTLSNSKSFCLMSLFTGTRLRSLIKASCFQAKCAFYLKKRDWEAFSLLLMSKFDLECVAIMRKRSYASGKNFYKFKIKPFTYREFNVNGFNFSKTFKKMSQKLMNNLVLHTDASRYTEQSQQILSLSANLINISIIIDPHYSALHWNTYQNLAEDRFQSMH